MAYNPDEHRPDDLHYGLYIGTVLDRDDPDGLGRVRVTVPGIIEESDWAWPMGGLGGGAPQRGSKFVPALNASVGIFFERGDPQAAPWYVTGNHGTGEGLTGASDPDTHAIETDDWLITVDDKSGQEKLELKDKTTGDYIRIVRVGKVIIVNPSTKLELIAAATESVLKGDAFGIHYLAHTHGGAGGATSPPLNAVTFDVPPGTHKSIKVKVG